MKHNYVMKTDSSEYLEIDFDWVRDQLLKRERIPSAKKSGPESTLTLSADKCLKEAGSLILPKSASIEKDIVRLGGNSIGIEGGVSLSTKRFSLYIKGAELLHIFVVTLGLNLEERASWLMRNGEQLEGYLLDRIGSFAVESLAENFENKLREYYGAKDLSVSTRFSPGYCDWHIEEQFKLAKILDFPGAGIRLTEGCMMVPKKSISAAVGIGPKSLFRKRASQRSICDKKGDCDYRRI